MKASQLKAWAKSSSAPYVSLTFTGERKNTEYTVFLIGIGGNKWSERDNKVLIKDLNIAVPDIRVSGKSYKVISKRISEVKRDKLISVERHRTSSFKSYPEALALISVRTEGRPEKLGVNPHSFWRAKTDLRVEKILNEYRLLEVQSLEKNSANLDEQVSLSLIETDYLWTVQLRNDPNDDDILNKKPGVLDPAVGLHTALDLDFDQREKITKVYNEALKKTSEAPSLQKVREHLSNNSFSPLASSLKLYHAFFEDTVKHATSDRRRFLAEWLNEIELSIAHRDLPPVISDHLEYIRKHLGRLGYETVKQILEVITDAVSWDEAYSTIPEANPYALDAYAHTVKRRYPNDEERQKRVFAKHIKRVIRKLESLGVDRGILEEYYIYCLETIEEQGVILDEHLYCPNIVGSLRRISSKKAENSISELGIDRNVPLPEPLLKDNNKLAYKIEGVEVTFLDCETAEEVNAEHLRGIEMGLKILKQYGGLPPYIRVFYEENGEEVGRACLNIGEDGMPEIFLNVEEEAKVALHETIHLLEFIEPLFTGVAGAFASSRLIHTGVKFEEIGEDEFLHVDHTPDEYTMKFYPDGASEIFTTGIQEFANSKEALEFARNDYPHFLLCHSIITGEIKKTF